MMPKTMQTSLVAVDLKEEKSSVIEFQALYLKLYLLALSMPWNSPSLIRERTACLIVYMLQYF